MEKLLLLPSYEFLARLLKSSNWPAQLIVLIFNDILCCLVWTVCRFGLQRPYQSFKPGWTPHHLPFWRDSLRPRSMVVIKSLLELQFWDLYAVCITTFIQWLLAILVLEAFKYGCVVCCNYFRSFLRHISEGVPGLCWFTSMAGDGWLALTAVIGVLCDIVDIVWCLGIWITHGRIQREAQNDLGDSVLHQNIGSRLVHLRSTLLRKTKKLVHRNLCLSRLNFNILAFSLISSTDVLHLNWTLSACRRSEHINRCQSSDWFFEFCVIKP